MAIPVAEVYPIPASEISIWETVLAVLTSALPTAVPIPDVGVLKYTIGSVGYPLPPSVIVIVPIPALEVTNNAVAAAPTP